MFFCPQCGYKIPENEDNSNAKFCPECGFKLPKIEVTENTEKEEPQKEINSSDSKHPEESSDKKRGWIYVLIGLGVGLIVVFVLFLVLTKGSDFFNRGNETYSAYSSQEAGEEISEKWSGSWYGVMYIRSAGGQLEQLQYQNLDIFMVVDGQKDGSGEYAIFVDGSEKAIAKGKCTLRQNGMYTKYGEFCGVEVVNANWVLLASTDDESRYTLSDEVETTEGKIAFAISLKKWGEVWDLKEGGSQLDIAPSAISAYNEMLTRREPAPYTVNGIDRTVWSSLEGTEQMSWDILVEGDTDAADLSEPQANGDGIMASQEDFWSLVKWINSMDQTTLHTSCTYETVKNSAGIEGKDDGNHGATSVSAKGDHYIYYYNPTQTMYLCIKFRVGDESNEWYVSEFTYYGFSAEDIPA